MISVPPNERILQTVEQRPEILQQMLATVLNIVMFEDCRNQWSMSRPLLGLILLNEEVRLRMMYLRIRCCSQINNGVIFFPSILPNCGNLWYETNHQKSRLRWCSGLRVWWKALNGIYSRRTETGNRAIETSDLEPSTNCLIVPSLFLDLLKTWLCSEGT